MAEINNAIALGVKAPEPYDPIKTMGALSNIQLSQAHASLFGLQAARQGQLIGALQQAAATGDPSHLSRAGFPDIDRGMTEANTARNDYVRNEMAKEAARIYALPRSERAAAMETWTARVAATPTLGGPLAAANHLRIYNTHGDAALKAAIAGGTDATKVAQENPGLIERKTAEQKTQGEIEFRRAVAKETADTDRLIAQDRGRRPDPVGAMNAGFGGGTAAGTAIQPAPSPAFGTPTQVQTERITPASEGARAMPGAPPPFDIGSFRSPEEKAAALTRAQLPGVVAAHVAGVGAAAAGQGVPSNIPQMTTDAYNRTQTGLSGTGAAPPAVSPQPAPHQVTAVNARAPANITQGEIRAELPPPQAQLAGYDAATGTLRGKTVAEVELEKKSASEYQDKVVPAANTAHQQNVQLDTMASALKRGTVPTGPGFNALQHTAGVIYQSMKMANYSDAESIAKAKSITGLNLTDATIFNKEATQMGLKFARETEGARQAVMAINIALGANPTRDMAVGANLKIIDVLKASNQWTQDKARYATEWIKRDGNLIGFDTWFNKTHPEQAYVSRAYPAALPSNKEDRVHGVTYQIFHTDQATNRTVTRPAIWNGEKNVFHPVQDQQ